METTITHGKYEMKLNDNYTISVFRNCRYIGLLGESCIQMHEQGKEKTIVIDLEDVEQ